MSKLQPPRSPSLPHRLIGYARVSPMDNQVQDTQMDELRSAGCNRIFEEQGSGTVKDRPVLNRLLSELATGDVLVVVSLDRIALSLGHLLEMLEKLAQRGIHFRSIHDPIDTSTPQGMFALEILRSVIELESRLTAERSKAGIKAAKLRGKLPGNPGLRERKPEAIRAVSQARDKRYLDELLASAPTWLPVVQQLRPTHGWDNVVEVLNRQGQDWTIERLRRAVHRLVRENMADQKLLIRSTRRIPANRLMKLVAAITIADPKLSLRDIAAQLDKLGEKPVRGGRKWQPSSVRNLLDDAHRFGLIPR